MSIERLHEAVNAHDADALASPCSADVTWRDPAAPGPLQGREAVRRFHREVMFRAIPDVRVVVVDGPYFGLDRADVAVRLRISGTMNGPLEPPGFAPTARPIAFETAEFSHFERGLLCRHTVVLDMLDLARQIGAAPQRGSPGERVGVWLQRVAAWLARQRIGDRGRS